jgi:chromosome segregation ATPase
VRRPLSSVTALGKLDQADDSAKGCVPAMTSIDLLEPLRRRRSQLQRLADQVKALERGRDDLQRAIADYKAFRPEIEKGKIESLEINATNLSWKIADEEFNTANLSRRLHRTNAAKVSPLVVWKYFSAEQKQLRSEASRLTSELSSAKQLLSKDQGTLGKVRSDINVARKRVSDQANFDLDGSEMRLSSLGPEIERLKAAHAADSADLARIETKVRPHTQELDRLKSELATFNADIARAGRFEQELSSASNSYERAMIHKECEAKFGTGSPKQVTNERRGRIRSLENNIPKLERRIRDELQKLERIVGHLLIDGNNACYERGSFIGLRAISALLRELGNRYKITVVFDARIRDLMRTDTQGIERALGTSVNTYVAPTKTAADEYLLKLADQDNSAFILSNDRYAEFHDYNVVKSGRVFRFLIAEGTLMANDIDISVNF